MYSWFIVAPCGFHRFTSNDSWSIACTRALGACSLGYKMARMEDPCFSKASSKAVAWACVALQRFTASALHLGWSGQSHASNPSSLAYRWLQQLIAFFSFLIAKWQIFLSKLVASCQWSIVLFWFMGTKYSKTIFARNADTAQAAMTKSHRMTT